MNEEVTMTTYVGLAIGGTQLSNRATALLSVRDLREKDSHKNGIIKGEENESIRIVCRNKKYWKGI